jgi:hypothetical protein
MLKKILMFALLTVALNALMAQTSSDTNPATGQEGAQPAKPLSSFELLEQGMTRAQIEEALGLPNQYAGNQSQFYIYDIEDNQRVILVFNAATGILNRATVAPFVPDVWPSPSPIRAFVPSRLLLLKAPSTPANNTTNEAQTGETAPTSQDSPAS